MGGMETHDFERRFLGILNDPEQFPGPKRVALMKLVAEGKCDAIKKRWRKLPEEEQEAKLQKCLKKQLLNTWYALRLDKEVEVKGIKVKVVGKDLVLETTPHPSFVQEKREEPGST